MNIKFLLNRRGNKTQQSVLTSYESILCKAKPDSPSSRKCMLCLTKKYHSLFLKINPLNKRNEPVSKCRLQSKHFLSNNKFRHSSITVLDNFLVK